MFVVESGLLCASEWSKEREEEERESTDSKEAEEVEGNEEGSLP